MILQPINISQYIFIQRILLMLGVICMIIPFFWIIIYQYSETKAVHNFMKTIGTQPVNLEFENIKVKTIQDKQKSINLTAPSAKIYDLTLSRIDMEKPVIALSEKDKPTKLLTANRGFYKHKNQTMTLSNKVSLSEDTSLKVNTDKMVVDLNNFKIKLPQGVDAVYKNNSLKAKDVEFQKNTNKAIFKGGIKLVIHPHNS